MKPSARDYLALALDNMPSLSALDALVTATTPSIAVFKIGLEQFTRFGPPVLETVRRAGGKIFLDLKFHDIPNTVGRAVEAACGLGVDFLTVHTSGGLEMMVAAAAAARKCAGRAPKIVGVTLLTSIGEAALHGELLVDRPAGGYVKHLASLAVAARLDGIVCSAADLPSVKPSLPAGFEIITPGIRPPGSDTHDQKRITAPAEAMKNGATLLVLGRAVTGADDAGKAAAAIAGELDRHFS
jgi:orotidine-5'-phosphate decarboxylase